MLPVHQPGSENEFKDAARRYLVEIYHLSEDEPWISPTRLALQLNITVPATTRMIKYLAEQELVEAERYKGVRLKAQGCKIALLDIRRYRLVECFLVDKLGFDWHEAYELAGQMSQNLPRPVADRLEVLLDYPKVCPYGESIPTCNGEISDPHDRPLTMVEIGRKGTISRVKVRELEKLRYLGELGLVPNAPLEVMNRLPFNGPVQLKVGCNEATIDFDLAATLRVLCSAG